MMTLFELDAMTKAELICYTLALQADIDNKLAAFKETELKLSETKSKYEKLKDAIKSVVVVID